MEIFKFDGNDKEFENFLTSRKIENCEVADKNFWQEMYSPSNFEPPAYVGKFPKENAVVAAEIKIGIAESSLEEIIKLIQKIRDVCKSDFKFSANIEGNFF